MKIRRKLIEYMKRSDNEKEDISSSTEPIEYNIDTDYQNLSENLIKSFRKILNSKSVENNKNSLQSDFCTSNIEFQNIINHKLNNSSNIINKTCIDFSMNSTTKLTQNESIPFYTSIITNSEQNIFTDNSIQAPQNINNKLNTAYLNKPLIESFYEKISASKCEENVIDNKQIISSIYFSSNESLTSTIRNSITYSKTLSQSKNLSDSLGVKLVFKYENGKGKFVAVPTVVLHSNKEEDIKSKHEQNEILIIKEKAKEIVLGSSCSNTVIRI